MEFNSASPVISALIIGIIYGATFCTLTCSPFIASYIIGTDRGTRRGMWLSIIFNAGRVLTYAMLGLLVGLAGGKYLVEGVYAMWGALIFGTVVAGIGLWIALRRRSPAPGCGCSPNASWFDRMRYRLIPKEGDGGELSAAGMGILIGLIPCPPLIALLVFAAAAGSATMGLTLGLVFGIGTLVSPLIIVAGAAGWFSDRVARDSPLMTSGLRRFAGLMLVLLGTWTIYNALTGGSITF